MDARSRAASSSLFATRQRRLLLAAGIVAALAAVLAAALVARGGSASPARAAGTVTVRKTSLGTVLATRGGRTLYLFAIDRRGRSACTAAACVKFWPPLVVKGPPTAAKGVRASLLGTIRRPGGARQVTYAGHPLYRFALDTSAGQTKGEGLDHFGGKWYAVSPAGGRVMKPAAPAPSSSGSSGGGYGY